MDDLSKHKPIKELTRGQGPRKRFFVNPAAEAGKEEGRDLGDRGREAQAEIGKEGTVAPVESKEGGNGMPKAPRHCHFEMLAVGPAGGPVVHKTPGPLRGERNFVLPEVLGSPSTTAPQPTVRRRHFEMRDTPPAEATLGGGNLPSGHSRGTSNLEIQEVQRTSQPLPPKVPARRFESPGVRPAEGLAHGLPLGPTVPQPPVAGPAIIATQGEERPSINLPQAGLRRRHFESPVLPAEAAIDQPPAGGDLIEMGLPPAPRRRHFVLAEGCETPTGGESAEPRTLQDIEASPDSGVEVPLSVFVDQLIDDSRPIDPKLKYYTPPPEAQRLMVRNIARRHNGATHPLEGYYSPQDPSNIHFDNTQYPDNFAPPLISYHTEDQLRNVHWKVMKADYNTATYQEKLHFVKGARLTQLEWELNNINLLGEIGKELQECKDELLPLVLN